MPSHNGARLTPDAAKRNAFAERSLTRTRSFAAGVSGMVVSLYFRSAAGTTFPYPGHQAFTATEFSRSTRALRCRTASGPPHARLQDRTQESGAAPPRYT